MPWYSYKADSADGYRFGFNGQEHEAEGFGDYYSFAFRIHDARLGKFLSVDPLAPEYPWNGTYVFAENDVIRCIDLEGAEKFFASIVDLNEADNPKLKGTVSVRISIIEDQSIQSQLEECKKAGVSHLISWDGGSTFQGTNQYRYANLECYLNSLKIIDDCLILDVRGTKYEDMYPKPSPCGNLQGAVRLSPGESRSDGNYFVWSSVLTIPDAPEAFNESVSKSVGEVGFISFQKEYLTPGGSGSSLVTFNFGAGDVSNNIQFIDDTGNPIPFTIDDSPNTVTSYLAGNEADIARVGTYNSILQFTIKANSSFTVKIDPNTKLIRDAWNYDMNITNTTPCGLDNIEGCVE